MEHSRDKPLAFEIPHTNFNYSSKTGSPVLTGEEETRLSLLRNKLFEKSWSGSEFKAILRDQMASEVYTDKTGFSIYVGSADHACDLLSLEVNGITYILNTAAGDPSCQMTQDIYGDKYRCLRIAAGDMPGYNITQHFQDTWQFIEEARKAKAKILVHCVAGASRSSTIVIAYLMQLHGWSLEMAGTHVRRRRARVFPNLGFLKQLELHQSRVTGSVKKV